MKHSDVTPYLVAMSNAMDKLAVQAEILGGEWREWMDLRAWPQGTDIATVEFEIDARLEADDLGIEHWGVRQIRAAELLFDVVPTPASLAELGYDRATGTLRGRKLA
ncbi:hypothetical protein [Lentzea sp. NEAU-D7]|uniref:hypothetical protein n=1 Tax=Lentzea sp. NEAU-D7 TaxID=2994667 RepID=UPI00224AD2A2|nr:hypothetical protein [Lentzea sp. NEAU-D7]MCX2949959.1 hypothetical protein [Lentzea sp. NEAU-D7]